MLRISLLGQPKVEYQGLPLEVELRKGQALLYYLACHADPVSRRQLAGLLWPDRPDAEARRQLSYALYHLNRRHIAPLQYALVVAAPPDSLTLNPDLFSQLTVDVLVFRNAAGEILRCQRLPDQARALEAGLALYRGEFLAGFAAPGSDLFEDWLAREREALRQLAHQASLRLSSLLAGAGRAASAARLAEAALTLEPHDEAALRQVMRLHVRQGRRALALRHYESVVQTLQADLGVSPEAATQTLYHAILEGRPAEPDPGPAMADPAPSQAYPAGHLPVWVGRSVELQQLHAGLAQAGPSQSAWVAIAGAAGIGKTTLIHAALRATPGRIFEARCHEATRDIPYVPVIEALRAFGRQTGFTLEALALNEAWHTPLAALLPELTSRPVAGRDPAYSPHQPLAMVRALTALMEALAARWRCCWLFEDVQWADSATLQFLTHLAGQSHISAAFVVAYRNDPLAPQLAGLLQALHAGQSVALTLAEFTPGDVQQLIAPLVQRPDDSGAVAAELWRLTGGNPLFVTESVRALLGQTPETGRLDLERVRQLQTGADLPPTAQLERFFEQRLAALPEAARDVAQVAAVAGPAFELDTLRLVCQLPEAEFVQALEALERHHLVRLPGRGQGEFCHALLQRLVYRSLSAARAGWLHRRLAEVLEGQSAAPPLDLADTLARHYVLGGVPERAAHYSLLAAQRALSLATLQPAIDYFEQALELWPPGGPPDRRAEVLLELAQVLNWKGDPAAALKKAQLALAFCAADSNPALYARGQLRVAEALVLAGQWEPALAAVDAALGLLRQVAPPLPAQLARGLVIKSNILQRTHHAPAEIEPLVDEGIAMLRGAQETAGLARALIQKANLELRHGDYAGAVQLFLEAEAFAARPPADPLTRIVACNSAAYFELHQGRWEQAGRLVDTALETASQSQNREYLARVLFTKGELHRYRAEWQAATDVHNRGLAIAQEYGLAREHCLHLLGLGQAALDQGQSERSSAYFNRALGVGQMAHLDRWLQAEIQLNLGRAALDLAGPDGAARGHFETALALATASHRLPLAMRAREQLAVLEAAGGAVPRARAELVECLAFHEARHNGLAAALVKRSLSQALRTTRPQAAAAFGQEAETALAGLGARGLLAGPTSP